ncbi:conserved hypothetical protein [Ricinus communis]|uniref:Uncharacterized protein n=1 Tax=Ricinus communis TaxID=3988 RepID=B9SX79_RICCO|nr:conserved hypothetical protein [Ricinus communis]
MEKLCRNFLWVSRSDSKGLSLVKWSSVVKPKSQGRFDMNMTVCGLRCFATTWRAIQNSFGFVIDGTRQNVRSGRVGRIESKWFQIIGGLEKGGTGHCWTLFFPLTFDADLPLFWLAATRRIKTQKYGGIQERAGVFSIKSAYDALAGFNRDETDGL